jgi:Reverse transcriptase (RNA-dependent DNA polymerase)
MPDLTLHHFRRATADIGSHGDNDTLPFDVDNRFIKDNEEALAKLAFAYSQELGKGDRKSAKNAINSVHIFSERLLAPTGPVGFRITTKIHPFWNIYFNGLGIAIAEVLEPKRSARAHSYRFAPQGDSLFNRSESWRTFRQATINDCLTYDHGAVVVQTDISSFYEHVSHHRIENRIDDLFPNDETIAAQVDRLLNRFASGRSFGLPVGGQCSRILAELLLSLIDQQLTDAKITWRRYVDDFVLITTTQAEAYRALSILAHALADYGLTLNRTKTTLLTSKHYIDYVRTQLGGSDDEATKLLEIDLHFDPYSDTRESDYDELKQLVESLDIRTLLDLELQKAQPDTFLVSQIGRTLRLHDPKVALQLCSTLLSQMNLHAFRASWSTIMRGIAQVRADDAFRAIFGGLDQLLDAIPSHSSHLLTAEASCLHYFRTIRFQRTERRAQYVLDVYSSTTSQTVKRACIECWRNWRDRSSFTRERNKWNALQPEVQRMLWLAAGQFGDEGDRFRQQVRQSLPQIWRLGVERNNNPTFASIYADWMVQ